MFIEQSSWKGIVGLSVTVATLLMIWTAMINHTVGPSRAAHSSTVSVTGKPDISPTDLTMRQNSVLVVEQWSAH